MNLMQCTKKHFYDGDKFTVCPYCTGATGNYSIMNGSVDSSSLKPSMPNNGTQHSPTVVLDEDTEGKTRNLL
ncbi:hypothetical protein SAMN02910292_02582 [Lachnospiraceae bacterium XBB2008]|nr:hypothetical protein SAMN02910292_02582 [Lachnospiraceae bacterium XBB2008]